MDICESNRLLDLEVRHFMENVSDIKEESITDFLVWKWRELDKRFNYLRVRPFNHEEESSITGADFDIELWLVGRKRHVKLAVQAKKFIKQTDAYVSRLRYPRGTKGQMNKLLNYSKSKDLHPFYFIYSLPDSNTSTMCRQQGATLGAVFTADARRLEEYADQKLGKVVTRDMLLSVANPFHCMFCCPLACRGKYFDTYFGSPDILSKRKDEGLLPDYVRHLLQRSHTDDLEKSALPRQFRLVGVYDLRDDSQQ